MDSEVRGITTQPILKENTLQVLLCLLMDLHVAVLKTINCAFDAYFLQ